MKKLFTLTTTISIGAVLALLTACQTTSTTSATAQTEALLAQSGFKLITVTTPKQQQEINGLPQGRVSAVKWKYNGKLYYVYPTATKDRIYVGKQKQLDAYNHALAAQQAQSGMNPAPTMTYQGHGPHQIVAEEFDGFGPMGTAQLGDW